MTDRTEWKRFEPVVRQVIHAWDPYCLLEGGAPGDEWDSEILQIVGRTGRITSAAEAAAVVSDVFTSAFHPEEFGQDDCAEVGKKLYEALKDSGLNGNAEQMARGDSASHNTTA